MKQLTPQERSLRIRWTVLFLLFLAITINILDRQVLSLAAPVLRDRFGFSNTAYGIVVFWFLLGMTLGQIPAGMLLDRIGARTGFGLIIAWWSVANMLHAVARSVGQFSALRFLLGVGECGTYSGGVKVIGQLFPPTERAFAGGLFNSGSLAGAIVAPPVIMYTILHYGWPAAFLIPSSLGLLWIVPWLMTYTSTVSARGMRSHASTVECPSLSRLLKTSPVWGVILMRALAGPVAHFYWYWLPEYLKRERAMSLESIGMFAWIPF
ncbi:MAG: MFS transporter, partial [Acidobacteriaceae bacterium]|nr:MFS transporter [Acidobacteriaceae bacterium]